MEQQEIDSIKDSLRRSFGDELFDKLYSETKSFFELNKRQILKRDQIGL